MGTSPTVLPWDLMARDHLRIWSLSLMICGSPAAIGSWDVGVSRWRERKLGGIGEGK